MKIKLTKNRIIIILFIVIALILSFSISRCNRYKNLYEYTKVAYNDTVTQYMNKNKELYSANLLYVTDISDLKKKNKELYNEVKSLQDNPVVITKIKTVYQLDTISLEAPVSFDTLNGNFESQFNYDDEWTKISGRFNGNAFTNFGLFSLDKLSFNCNITSDIVEKDGQLYFISKSDNPYMSITNTQGTMLSPEKSKVLRQRLEKPWGVMIGAGLSMTVYDNNIKILPALQLTIGRKILSF